MAMSDNLKRRALMGLALLFFGLVAYYWADYYDKIPWVLSRPAYLQQVSPDGAIICWRTKTSLGTEGRVHIGESADSLDRVFLAKGVSSVGREGFTEFSVRATGLAANTVYHYRYGIVDGPLWGDSRNTFRSAPVRGTGHRFRAWLVGDSGNGGVEQLQVRDAMIGYTEGGPIDLFIHVGDLAYSRGLDREFTRRFFRPYRDVLARVCFWPTPGNHEMKSADSPSETGAYFEAFRLPTAGEMGGVASGTEAYYSFDYANVHFISIDSAGSDLARASTMLEWLEADLASTDQQWVVAFWHHPPYSRGSHNSDSFGDSYGRMVMMRENIVPTLEAGGADLLLSGHSHDYERSYPISGVWGYGKAPNHKVPSFEQLETDGKILDTGSGDPDGDGPYLDDGGIFIVLGHGGAKLGGYGLHPVMRYREVEHGSCLLTVDGGTLTVENLRSDGTISDRFQVLDGDERTVEAGG